MGFEESQSRFVVGSPLKSTLAGLNRVQVPACLRVGAVRRSLVGEVCDRSFGGVHSIGKFKWTARCMLRVYEVW